MHDIRGLPTLLLLSSDFQSWVASILDAMRWSLRFLVEPIGNISLLYNLIRNWDVVSISSLLIWNPRTYMLVQRPSYSPNRLLTSQKKLSVLQSSSCKLAEDSRLLDNPTRAPAVCFDVYAAACFQKRESGSPCVPLSSLLVQKWFIISSTEIIPITCMTECQLDSMASLLWFSSTDSHTSQGPGKRK